MEAGDISSDNGAAPQRKIRRESSEGVENYQRQRHEAIKRREYWRAMTAYVMTLADDVSMAATAGEIKTWRQQKIRKKIIKREWASA